MIGQADLFVGPPSSGMHLANSYRVPSVIIYGGYESPMSYNYPQSEALYNSVVCAPCWKTTECPYARECLHGITPKDVFERMAKRLPDLTAKPSMPLTLDPV
jgi:ADP-heptose:LPS heptosyltransferase